MAIKRIFLGTDQPALVSTVDYLIANFADAKWLDLSNHVLVTPGGRASRRLRELIYTRARGERLRYLPPTIATIGSIPESLYESRLPFASEWVQQLTWARALREVDADARRIVFPQTPDDLDDYTESDWLALGRLLQGTYRGLAAESLSFANVAAEGAKMQDFPKEERKRWDAMGVIQEKYLYLLRQRQLWDRQTARIRAIHGTECETEQQIILIGTADIRRALREMLEQVADRVTSLVFAPEDWAGRFDAAGCIVPSEWQSATIDFSNAEISFVDSFSEQSAISIQSLAELGNAYSCDQVTIGCPDDRLVPHLQRSLAAHGINGREVKGQRVTESPVFRFLAAVREAIFSESSFESYATLGRHPDVFQWLSEGVSAAWVNEADRYRGEHLPTKVTERWLGSDERYKHLITAFHRLAQLLEPLEIAAQPMSHWSIPISKVLKTVYGKRRWERGNPDDNLGVGAFNTISRFLTEQATLPPEVAPILTAAEALELLLEEIDEARVPPPADPDAVELLGWLELPLDDAPVLVLTGLTEGIVPNSTSGDLFLPNSLRRHLQISDNDRRYARDLYALSVILASRKKTQIVVGRVDDEGEPLRPSRLLFAIPEDKISERWLDYFERDEIVAIPIDPEPENTSSTKPSFSFAIPEPSGDFDTVATISPTGIRDYLSCPYRFYLKRILKLRPVEDEAREMSALHFGNMAHDVLEEFGRGEAKDSTESEEIREMLDASLKKRCARRFGRNPSPAVRVQIRQLQLRLSYFAIEQAKQARDGWRILHIELESSTLDPVPQIWTPDQSASLPLHGKVDRIDRHEETGQYRILDYKTSDSGAAPEKTHRQGPKNNKKWIDLQLPLYRQIALASNLEGVDGDISKLNEVGYVVLPKDVSQVKFSFAGWNDHDFADADRLASEVVEKIINREFWPPSDPKYDDFPRILMTTVPERPEIPQT